MDRVVIFIDGSNFYHNLVAHGFPKNVDFSKFSKILCGDDRHLIRTYYYNIIYDQSEDPNRYKRQQIFLNNIRRTPYLEFRAGALQKKSKECPHCKKLDNYHVEKGVDVSIAVDMLSMANNNRYDTAILVSSDGDLARACQEVKNLMKHIENAYFKDGSSWHLLNICDRAILIDRELIDKCLRT